MKNFIKIFAFNLMAFFAMAQPVVKHGELDLRQVDFENLPIQSLDGHWTVFPHRLLTPAQSLPAVEKSLHVPFLQNWRDIPAMETGFHEFGAATYCLTIWMPEKFPQQGFRIGHINTAFEMYLNGAEIFGAGQVSENEDDAIPNKYQSFKVADLKPGKNELRLLISNFHHHRGGPEMAVQMSAVNNLLYKRNLELGSALFLAGCLLLAGVFAIGLFWFKTKDLSGLFFALFTFAYAIWVLSSEYGIVNSIFQDLEWVVAIRLEYLSVFVSVIFYVYFAKITLIKELPAWIFHTVAGITAGLAFTIAFLPPPVITLLIPYYYVFLAAVFVAVSVAAVSRLNFQHKLTWVSLVGVVALLVVIVSKVLASNHLIIENPLVTVAANIVFVFSQALAMAIIFGRNYRDSSRAALAAAQAREDFLNTISHELKTPLNAILGMSTFLENSKLRDSQEQKVRAIRRNGETLLSMINDVLSITQLNTGELKLTRNAVSIEGCVESAVALSRQYQRRDKVRFEYKIDDSIPALLRGDASRIKQILMNLLNNAFKFTEKGHVLLTAHLEKESDETALIGFRVQDTGIGIGRADRKRLFEKFRQGETGNKRKFRGVGLGLKVVNRLVEMMGGHLVVRSERGQGTEVCFNISLEKMRPDALEGVTSIFRKNEIDTDLKILYAEDNPVNQKLLAMMLENLGLKVDLANNGKEAYAMAMKKYYNIIFMDIQMPEMDGLEAARKIVEHSNARPIIVAVTANEGDIDRRHCFEAGMNDFISKPVNPDKLKMAVIKWQGLKKYLDENAGENIRLSS